MSAKLDAYNTATDAVSAVTCAFVVATTTAIAPIDNVFPTREIVPTIPVIVFPLLSCVVLLPAIYTVHPNLEMWHLVRLVFPVFVYKKALKNCYATFNERKSQW